MRMGGTVEGCQNYQIEISNPNIDQSYADGWAEE